MKERREAGKNGKALLKLYGVALGLSGALLLLGALLFWLTDLPEEGMKIGSLAAISGGGGLFAYGAAHLRGRGGLLTGLLSAAVFIASLLLLTLLALPETVEFQGVSWGLALPLLVGAVFGIRGMGKGLE